MNVSLKHKFVSPKADGVDEDLVRPSDWNNEHDLVVNEGKLVGRTSAGAGQAEEVQLVPGTNVQITTGPGTLEISATGSTTTLAALDDVDLAGLQDGDVLSYSDGTTKWYNERKQAITDGGNF